MQENSAGKRRRKNRLKTNERQTKQNKVKEIPKTLVAVR